MATLGDGKNITTVGDKEIVLTSITGEQFKMKIADLAEAVRQVMPVATAEKNGLLASSLLTGGLVDINQINFDTYKGVIPIIATKGTSGGTSPSLNDGDWFILWQYGPYTSYMVQIAVGFSVPGFYIRNSYDKGVSWDTWSKY